MHSDSKVFARAPRQNTCGSRLEPARTCCPKMPNRLAKKKWAQRPNSFYRGRIRAAKQNCVPSDFVILAIFRDKRKRTRPVGGCFDAVSLAFAFESCLVPVLAANEKRRSDAPLFHCIGAESNAPVQSDFEPPRLADAQRPRVRLRGVAGRGPRPAPPALADLPCPPPCGPCRPPARGPPAPAARK